MTRNALRAKRRLMNSDPCVQHRRCDALTGDTYYFEAGVLSEQRW